MDSNSILYIHITIHMYSNIYTILTYCQHLAFKIEVSRSNLYCTSIDLADIEVRHKYVNYSYFSVGNSSTNYTLSVGGYTGTAGDSLSIGFAVHNGREFITHDIDNDRHSGGVNCAEQWQSA